MGLKKNGNLIVGVQSEIHVGASDAGGLNCHLPFGVRQGVWQVQGAGASL